MNTFHQMKIFGVGKVGPKGQVVIPSEAREKLGLHPGEKVIVVGMPHPQAVIIMSEDTFEMFIGRIRAHYEDFCNYLDSHNNRGGKGRNG